jgi:hypothetical protein
MTDVRQGGPSTRQILLIVFGTLGGVLLALLLAGGVFVYWRYSSVSPAEHEVQAAADAFMQDVHAGHVQAAYQRMTGAFRARRSFQEFERQVTQNPTFTHYTSLTRHGVQFSSTPTGTVAMVSFTASDSRQSMSFKIVLMHENGQWLVEKVS